MRGIFEPATQDLAGLQAAVDAADAVGGGTVWLGPGDYNLGTGSLKVGQSATQHHINIVGINRQTTRILGDTSDGHSLIYLNLEKYVTIADLSVINQGANAGIGMELGGDAGAGTQTNGNLIQHVSFQNFDKGLVTSAGQGTSSEIRFDGCDWQGNNIGFYSSNFNGLNYLLLMPEFYGNGTAFFIATGNATVIGGSASGNGTDFNIVGGNDGTVKIVAFRSESFTGPWLIASANNYLSIEDCILHPATVGSEIIRSNPGGNLRVVNSTLNGYITWNGGGQCAIDLENVTVNTSGTDWSLSNQISAATPPFGPGFRMTNNQGAVQDARFHIRNVWEGSNNTMYPDVDGVVITRASDNVRVVLVT